MLIAVFAPLAGAFLLPLLSALSRTVRNLTALALVGASLVASLALLPGALRGDVVTFSLAAPLGLSLAFTADALAVFMAIVSSLVGAIIMLFSFDYISHYENQNEYYVMATVFLGAMMGLVFSTNLVLPLRLLGDHGDRELAVDRFLPRQVRRPEGGQGLPRHGGGRARDADRHPRRVRTHRDLRSRDNEGYGPSARRLGSPPRRPPVEVGHAAVPDVAARRRRRAVAGHRSAARRRPGQDRRLRVRAALPRDVRVRRGVAH